MKHQYLKPELEIIVIEAVGMSGVLYYHILASGSYVMMFRRCFSIVVASYSRGRIYRRYIDSKNQG
jgi:hypothetical protein